MGHCNGGGRSGHLLWVCDGEPAVESGGVEPDGPWPARGVADRPGRGAEAFRERGEGKGETPIRLNDATVPSDCPGSTIILTWMTRTSSVCQP